MSATDLSGLFAARTAGLHSSFIRDILAVANDPGVISFAGGLPDPAHFPAAELAVATERVLTDTGPGALQYGPSEGLAGLREWIAERYRKRLGLEVAPEEVLITQGSQQALDLLGKVLLDTGDGVVIEEPGYLGAIQAFSLYRPRFLPVPVGPGGMDTDRLGQALNEAPKLLYCVPEFQNPSGISYSPGNREAVARAVAGRPMLVVEDDPYGELRFAGTPAPPFRRLLPERTVLLGSFSKTVAPALRLGWLVAPGWLMSRLLVAKQASDLHSNTFSQHVLLRFLREHGIDAHLEKVRRAYGERAGAMREAIARRFPTGVTVTEPEGGMFLWATLPAGASARRLFDRAIAEGVAFVPGAPFHLGREDTNTLRLNFTNASPETIETGIARLGDGIRAELNARRQ